MGIAAVEAATRVDDHRAEMNALSSAFHAALDMGENDLVEAYAEGQMTLAKTLGAREVGRAFHGGRFCSDCRSGNCHWHGPLPQSLGRLNIKL